MRLLGLDNQGIDDLVKNFEKDSKALKQELLKFCWFMRGGLTYEESHMLSPEERGMIAKIIEENLETTKESGLPFF